MGRPRGDPKRKYFPARLPSPAPKKGPAVLGCPIARGQLREDRRRLANIDHAFVVYDLDVEDVVRTIATENKGIDALAEAIAKFRGHFESSGERTRKHTEHWRNHLLELLESRLVERVLNQAGGEAALNQLAADVAERRKDPFTAVSEILSKSGL